MNVSLFVFEKLLVRVAAENVFWAWFFCVRKNEMLKDMCVAMFETWIGTEWTPSAIWKRYMFLHPCVPEELNNLKDYPFCRHSARLRTKETAENEELI